MWDTIFLEKLQKNVELHMEMETIYIGTPKMKMRTIFWDE